MCMASTNCKLKTISRGFVVLKDPRAKLLCFQATSNTLIKLSSALTGWKVPFGSRVSVLEFEFTRWNISIALIRKCFHCHDCLFSPLSLSLQQDYLIGLVTHTCRGWLQKHSVIKCESTHAAFSIINLQIMKTQSSCLLNPLQTSLARKRADCSHVLHMFLFHMWTFARNTRTEDVQSNDFVRAILSQSAGLLSSVGIN